MDSLSASLYAVSNVDNVSSSVALNVLLALVTSVSITDEVAFVAFSPAGSNMTLALVMFAFEGGRVAGSTIAAGGGLFVELDTFCTTVIVALLVECCVDDSTSLSKVCTSV